MNFETEYQDRGESINHISFILTATIQHIFQQMKDKEKEKEAYQIDLRHQKREEKDRSRQRDRHDEECCSHYTRMPWMCDFGSCIFFEFEIRD